MKKEFQISNFKFQIFQKKGFTILEITVVIFIITIGMLGILSLVNQSIQVEYINKNMIVASQLAQEGLELARNKRDVNWLAGENWKNSSTTFSNFDIVQDGTYAVDYGGVINGAVNNINDAGAKLYLNAGGFYTHAATATSTPFSRLITVGNESSASTSVTCLVRWQKGSNSYNFSAQTVLYDWR
jgi:prepilin-type N-terminal cleavage/methylation domain-containing protein